MGHERHPTFAIRQHRIEEIVMRLFLLMLCPLLATQAVADWDDYDYHEERNLSVDADGLTSLRIDAGAGSMKVNGVDGAATIDVTATILVSGARDDKARELIEDRMELTLERNGDKAILIADFGGSMGWSKGGAIALDVRVPKGMDLDIDDGSGSIEIHDTVGAVELNDGSGSIKVSNVAGVRVDDGSGSIDIRDASGDVRIDDGSGSVTVRGVTGSIVIDDGSGSINVSDVQGDFRVVDAGSGSVNYRDVAGEIDVP
jgi:hypothetical protein